MSQRPQQVRQNGIHLIGEGGMRGHQNPDLQPVLEAPQGQQASSVLTLPPGATHTAKKPNITMTGPPRKVGLGK